MVTIDALEVLSATAKFLFKKFSDRTNTGLRQVRVGLQWVISHFGLVFRWDQRLRPNGSTLVSDRSWD